MSDGWRLTTGGSLLTPAGIRHRIRLTQGYLARKEAEYEALKAEIAALRQQMEQSAPEKEHA